MQLKICFCKSLLYPGDFDNSGLYSVQHKGLIQCSSCMSLVLSETLAPARFLGLVLVAVGAQITKTWLETK
eukprot:1256826-Rhodomonas_salina.1